MTGAEAANHVLRRWAYALGILAVAGLALHGGIMVWAQNEFSQPESIVAVQATMLTHGGTLYPSLSDYPYTVNAYMPLFYFLESGFVRLGVSPVLGGRAISFMALLTILWVTQRTVLIYTADRRYSAFAAMLCATTSLLLLWGSTGQVDMLAVMLALSAFYQFSRFHVLGENSLWLSLALSFAALMVKQTAVAAPVAICLALLVDRPKWALSYGVLLSVAVGSICGVANMITHGGFLANTLFANINPFAWHKLKQHLQLFLLAAGPLSCVAVVCAGHVWRPKSRALLIYLVCAACVWLATGAKIGSDSNYQIETIILLVWVASAGLHAMKFFERFFARSKASVTLLHIPLILQLALNFGLMYPTLSSRADKELKFRQQIVQLRPYLAGGGRAIVADVNAALRTQGRLDVEPLIYTLLVEGGQIDPEPLRRDLASEAFSTLVLYFDVNHAEDLVDPEIPRLTAMQSRTVRRHYTLVANIPGPYLNGVFVYKPAGRPE